MCKTRKKEIKGKEEDYKRTRERERAIARERS